MKNVSKKVNTFAVEMKKPDTPNTERQAAALRLYNKAQKLHRNGNLASARRILDKSLKMCFTIQAQELAQSMDSVDKRARRPSNEDLGIPPSATNVQIHLKADVAAMASTRGRRASVVISDVEGKHEAEKYRDPVNDVNFVGAKNISSKGKNITKVDYAKEFGESSDDEIEESGEEGNNGGEEEQKTNEYKGNSHEKEQRGKKSSGSRFAVKRSTGTRGTRDSVKITTSNSARNITIQQSSGAEETHDISSGVLLINDTKFVKPSADRFRQNRSMSRYPVRMQGTLWKAPTAKNFYGFGRWRLRHFILTDHLLVYSASPEASVPRGMVDFTGAIIGSSIASKAKHRRKKTPTSYEFQLITNEMTFYMCALNEEDREKWISALTHNISLLSYNSETGHTESASGKRNGGPVERHSSTPPPPPRKAAAPPPPPPLPQESNEEPVGENTGPGRKEIYRSNSTVADKNSYQLLGVSRNATSAQVKKAYYKLARDFHPDKNPDANPHVFAAINTADTTLKGNDARENYDKRLKTKEVTRAGFVCNVVTSLHRKRVKIRECEVWSVNRSRLEFTNYKAGQDTQILYWAKPGKGMPSNKSTDFAEYRFVMELWRGEDKPDIKWPKNVEASRIILFYGKHLYEPFGLVLDTAMARDKMLEGLRLIRCAGSLLFTRWWEKAQKEGHK